jgi:hypothetical protein
LPVTEKTEYDAGENHMDHHVSMRRTRIIATQHEEQHTTNAPPYIIMVVLSGRSSDPAVLPPALNKPVNNGIANNAGTARLRSGLSGFHDLQSGFFIWAGPSTFFTAVSALSSLVGDFLDEFDASNGRGLTGPPGICLPYDQKIKNVAYVNDAHHRRHRMSRDFLEFCDLHGDEDEGAVVTIVVTIVVATSVVTRVSRRNRTENLQFIEMKSTW